MFVWTVSKCQNVAQSWFNLKFIHQLINPEVFLCSLVPWLRLPGVCRVSLTAARPHTFYKELSAHSSGHSDEPVWINGCRVNAVNPHQECGTCWTSSHTGASAQNTVTLICARSSDGPKIIQLLGSLSVKQQQLWPCSHHHFFTT